MSPLLAALATALTGVAIKHLVAVLVSALAFPVWAIPRDDGAALRARPGLTWLKAGAEDVPGLYVRPSSKKRRSKFLLLYSHGNQEDLASGASYLEAMAEACGCDCFGHEYVGYGLASGKPSERQVYASVDAAMAYLTRPVAEGGAGWSAGQIVPFGRSLGSAAAVHAAAKAAKAKQPCAGLLLQSPLCSGVHVLIGPVAARLLALVDPFKNYRKIGRASCGVSILHGTEDRVVPVSNGQRLARSAGPQLHELLLCPGRGHNNIPPATCFDFAAKFLDKLDAERRS